MIDSAFSCLHAGFNTFLERKILQKLGGVRGEQIRGLHVSTYQIFHSAGVSHAGVSC